MYPWIHWEPFPDPLGFAEHTLETTHLDEPHFDTCQRQEYIFLFSKTFRQAHRPIKSVFIVPRFFQWEQSSQGVMLTTHLSLVPRSRNSGAVITLLHVFFIYGPEYENGEWKSRTNWELEEMSTEENIVKWIKGQRISRLCHLDRMEEDRMPKKEFQSRAGRDEMKGKAQERMERRSRKRSSSAGSDKMERVCDR